MLVLSLPAGLRAQGNASNLLGRVEDLAIYPIIPVNRSDRTYTSTGYGFEFSFKIHDETRPMTLVERQKRCLELVAANAKAVCFPASPADTAFTPATIRPSRTGNDTTFNIVLNKLTITKWSIEVSVGNESSDIRSEKVAPGWALSGKISEFPILTLYATVRPDWVVSPYMGLSLLPADLKNVKLTRGDSTATVEASAVGGAGILGIVKTVSGMDLFAEVNYHVLRFSATGWKRPKDLDASLLPDFIENTGLSLRLGAQLPLGGKK